MPGIYPCSPGNGGGVQFSAPVRAIPLPAAKCLQLPESARKCAARSLHYTRLRLQGQASFTGLCISVQAALRSSLMNPPAYLAL